MVSTTQRNRNTAASFRVERRMITVNEAGRRGGLACLRNKGNDFFVEIGRKGQQAMREKYPNFASQWGKLGGRPKKADARSNHGGERGIDNNERRNCGPA